MTDGEVGEIDQAEREAASCERCDGRHCAHGTYLRPLVQIVGGRVKIEYPLCVHGVERGKQLAKEPVEPASVVFDKSLFPPEFWEARERERARLRKLKPTLEAKYGALTDEQLAPIDRAERELAACDDCDGQTCRKSDCRFLQPVIRLEGGEPKISRVECRVYAVNQFRKVCRHSSLPSKYADKTFDDYEVTDDNRRAVKLAKAFCSAKPREGLFLFGECGTGKTFLAALVVKEYLHDFKSVVFGDVPALLDEIKRTFDAPKKSTADLLARYCDCDLLVLDDIGAGQITEWNVGQLYEIVNARYNRGAPVIVTCNFDLTGLQRRLTLRDDFTAKRIVSRLSEMCTLAFLGTNDRRR